MAQYGIICICRITRADKADFLVELLDQGFNPAEQKDREASLLQPCIQGLQWSFGYDWFTRERDSKDIDTSRSRETLKNDQIPAKHGAKWRPTERYQINLFRTIWYPPEKSWRNIRSHTDRPSASSMGARISLSRAMGWITKKRKKPN